MNSHQDLDRDLVSKAFSALRKGEPRQARYWAEKATTIDPEDENPWLILAALSPPKESIGYLNKALEINPKSESARKGMHWAIQRLREDNSQKLPIDKNTIVQESISSEEFIFSTSLCIH